MKRIFTKTIRLASLLTLLISSMVPLAAHANGNAVLSASSVTANKGSAVVVTISLDTAGSFAFAYQADLSYSTSYFSSASIAMAPGSPFTIDPGSQDPDVSSGGNIHFTRFFTTVKNYNGAVATITLQSNGAAGATSINFKGICPDTSTTSNCSAVVDGGGTQLLGSLNDGTINLTVPPSGTTAGGTSSASKGSKAGSKKTATTATTPSSTTTISTDANETSTTDDTDTEGTHTVVLTVLDQDGKPVKNAKVVLNGVSGKTDANGKVTLKGLDAGTVQGNVYYGDQIFPISVKVNSSESTQSSKINVSIKKSGAAIPVLVAVIAVIIVAAAYFLTTKSHKHDAAPLPVVAATPPPMPHVTKTEFTEPLEKPEPKPAPKPEAHIEEPKKVEKPKEDGPLHEKALDPGTVFTPTEDKN